MMGKTHCASGVAAWLIGCVAVDAIGWHPSTTAVIAGATAAGISAYLPDVDAPHSKASLMLSPSYHLRGLLRRDRRLRWIGRSPSHPLIGTLVNAAFGHRGWTHTAIAALLAGLVPGVPTMLLDQSMWWVGLAVSVGYLAALAGDASTKSGIQFFRPFSDATIHLLPPMLRFTTGKRPERLLVVPVMWSASILAGLVLLG